MKTIYAMLLGISISAPIVQADQQSDRIKLFHQLTMTRGWELGLWRIKNDKKTGESAVRFKLSMTAQAFQYWILVHDRLIDKNGPFEEQIRRSFANGDLDTSTLKNPLYRDAKNEGGFGIGVVLNAEEYQKLAKEFEQFFSGTTK